MTEQSGSLGLSGELLSERLMNVTQDLLVLQRCCLDDAQDAHRHGAAHQALILAEVWATLRNGADSLVEGLLKLYASERDRS